MPALRELYQRRDLPRTTREQDYCEMPILDGKGRLVAWTRRSPEISDGLLRHPYAEHLVGGTVIGAYVQIDDPVDAKRAGAPPDWNEPWRCLALCAENKTFQAPRWRARQIGRPPEIPTPESKQPGSQRRNGAAR